MADRNPMNDIRAAQAFLKDALDQSRDERQAVLKAVTGKGFVRRASGARRSVDVAMPGKVATSIPSLRPDGTPGPDIKLRRYLVVPTGKAGEIKATSATYGVDMDRKSFEFLVARTAAETGKKERKAIQATIASCLDEVRERQRTLRNTETVRFDLDMPEGVVTGISRGRERARVDDYDFKQAPSRDQRQRTRQDDRLARIQEAARQRAERDVSKGTRRKPSTRRNDGPEIAD